MLINQEIKHDIDSQGCGFNSHWGQPWYVCMCCRDVTVTAVMVDPDKNVDNNNNQSYINGLFQSPWRITSVTTVRDSRQNIIQNNPALPYYGTIVAPKYPPFVFYTSWTITFSFNLLISMSKVVFRDTQLNILLFILNRVTWWYAWCDYSQTDLIDGYVFMWLLTLKPFSPLNFKTLALHTLGNV